MAVASLKSQKESRAIPRRGASSYTRRRARVGALLTLPALLPVTAIAIVPLVGAVYISLTDWPLFGDVTFVGFRNYIELATDPLFLSSVGFTTLYTAIVTLPILLLGYGLAAFVRSNRRGAVFFRTMFFLPYVVGLTTLSFILLVELYPTSGLVNVALKTLGVTGGDTAWFLRADTGLLAVCILVVWFAGGFTMMLLLGGMQAIPEEILEAAELDGAGILKRELFVTVPLVRRDIAMSLVVSVIGSFLAFQQFLILTSGGPGHETTTLVMLVWREAFIRGHIGAATAMGIIVMVIIAALSGIQLFALRDRREQ